MKQLHKTNEFNNAHKLVSNPTEDSQHQTIGKKTFAIVAFLERNFPPTFSEISQNIRPARTPCGKKRAIKPRASRSNI